MQVQDQDQVQDQVHVKVQVQVQVQVQGRRYISLVEPLRILVVSDDPLARAGLVARLGGREEIAVVGECGPAEVAATAASLAPAALLWDVGTAGSDPLLEAAGFAVVALAADEAAAADAVRAGARGVLSRDAPAGAVAAALAAAAQGLSVLDPEVAPGWIRPPEDAPSEGLTAREAEVLGLLAEGLSNKVIAARLGISEHTAKFHVNAILSKLGAESRAAAIVKAARLGLVAL
jgi:DNA-binding NarL/FixJ family response regulator